MWVGNQNYCHSLHSSAYEWYSEVYISSEFSRSSTYLVPLQVLKSPTFVPAQERHTVRKLLKICPTLCTLLWGKIVEWPFAQIFNASWAYIPCSYMWSWQSPQQPWFYGKSLNVLYRKSTVPVFTLSWNNLHHQQWRGRLSIGFYREQQNLVGCQQKNLVFLCVYVHKILDNGAKPKVC